MELVFIMLRLSTSTQGYLVGNPLTGDKIDDNSQIPHSHSFGIISDQLYEVLSYLQPSNAITPMRDFFSSIQIVHKVGCRDKL